MIKTNPFFDFTDFEGSPRRAALVETVARGKIKTAPTPHPAPLAPLAACGENPHDSTPACSGACVAPSCTALLQCVAEKRAGP